MIELGFLETPLKVRNIQNIYHDYKTEVIKLITKKIPNSEVTVENLKGNDHLQVAMISLNLMDYH